MTKMTKRAFSLLLTLTLLITILPYNVWADEQQKSDSRQNENNVTLSYMVVDKPKIEKNDTQNIVVGYTISGNLQINNAVMYYTNKESGEEYEVNAVYIDNEVAKFTYDIDVNNSGEYSVSRLIFFYGDNSQEILMSDTGIDAKYAVNIDINTSPDAYLTEEETVDTDITYEAIDEEGDKVECNSIEDAIIVASDNKNDIETVLKTLEIIDLTNEGKKVVENSWNNFISSLRGNFKDEVRDEMLTNIFEASGATLNSFASFVNTATAIAKGPESASSFVVLNPNVADTTGVLAQYGSTLGKVATGCKIGLPILGGILDFASMRKEGTNLQDATVKDLCKCNLARKFKEKMIKVMEI